MYFVSCILVYTRVTPGTTVCISYPPHTILTEFKGGDHSLPAHYSRQDFLANFCSAEVGHKRGSPAPSPSPLPHRAGSCWEWIRGVRYPSKQNQDRQVIWVLYAQVVYTEISSTEPTEGVQRTLSSLPLRLTAMRSVVGDLRPMIRGSQR